MSRFCVKCNRTLNDIEFYTSKDKERFPPDGRLNTCKKCLTMHVDNWNPDTFLWILEMIDVPYIKDEWDNTLRKFLEQNGPNKIKGSSILGKYLAKMKLKQHMNERWADTEEIARKSLEQKKDLMRIQGMSQEEIEEQLKMDPTPPKPTTAQAPVGIPIYVEPEKIEDGVSDSLTEEDRDYLRKKWGRSYSPEEWLKLEQLYSDMENSYDIHSAGAKDSLLMICKASLRANQLIDAGEIEAFQKATKVYNDLMKSAHLTEAQNKEDSSGSLDSIGQLVALCEKEQFVPRYYIDKPKDKIDYVIKDMQSYTRTLVTEELGLGNLIENSLRAMERERQKIEEAASKGSEEDEDELLFKDEEEEIMTDEDFEDFYSLRDETDEEGI